MKDLVNISNQYTPPARRSSMGQWGGGGGGGVGREVKPLLLSRVFGSGFTFTG